MNLPKTPLQGNSQQTTIAQANIAQPLVTTRTLVRSVVVTKDSAAAGTVLMSYGPSPLHTSLSIDAGVGGGVLDLARVLVKSTTAGDKVNWQSTY